MLLGKLFESSNFSFNPARNVSLLPKYCAKTGTKVCRVIMLEIRGLNEIQVTGGCTGIKNID